MKNSWKNLDIILQEEEIYINLNKIKKGDIFYECENNINLKMEALTDVVKNNEGYSFSAKSTLGICEIFISKYNSSIDMPNFCWEPIFFEICKGKLKYIIF